jgi:hypothetical protein
MSKIHYVVGFMIPIIVSIQIVDAPPARAEDCRTSNSTFCQNMRNADAVSKRNQADRDRQNAQQNGTSQYTGPNCWSSGASGSTVCGYQRSTR